jgi:hypothetical protein
MWRAQAVKARICHYTPSPFDTTHTYTYLKALLAALQLQQF